MEQFKGKVWVLGDDIDTDIIIPTEYLALPTVEDMKQYGFSPLRPELAGQIGEGDIIVAGSNFGCGSSREHAPLCLKTAGVSCVIAETFARIFYRNAINIGLPIIECPEAAKAIEAGDEVEIDFDSGKIYDRTKEQAPEIIKALKVKCVIAKSFARIFFRNSINNGLLLIENDKIQDAVKEGDEIEVTLGEKITYNGTDYEIHSLPDNLMEIINAGGLVEAMKKRNGVK